MPKRGIVLYLGWKKGGLSASAGMLRRIRRGAKHAGGNLARERPIQRWLKGCSVGVTATGTSQKTRKRGR